jgi:alkaline phosphatase D
MKINRRRALAFLGFGAATPAAAQLPKPLEVSFQHGVASGDPTQTSVILWTRITPEGAGGQIPYTWKLNPLDRRAGGAKSGSGVTGPDRDYTVKVDVGGLDPGRNYTFEFQAKGVTSPAGRTRTLPEGPTKDVVLAVASCTLYPNGYFNAYGAIADLPRVDAVLHLGDYIYEYGGDGSYGMSSPVAQQRKHEPYHECVTLADYRVRHAQYKRDAQTQAAHARAPWIVVWDDHETCNDSYSTGGQNHQPATEGDWNTRKAAAIKAYYEWMPIREPKGGGFAINRSFDFGDVASLFMLETRLTARDQQLTYSRDLPDTQTPEQVAAFRAKLTDPSRKMMATDQEAWLKTGMAASVASGRAWQVLGNEVVMARVIPPSLPKEMGEAAFAKASAGLPETTLYRFNNMAKLSALDLPYGLDMWDGYPADRQRLYGILKDTKANCVVVSGDSHAFWANELYDAPEGGQRVALEFGTTGITSPGGGDALPTIPLGDAFASRNREVLWGDQRSKGFVLLTLTHTEAKAEMMRVSTIAEATYTTAVVKTFTATRGPGGVSGLKEA